MTFPDSTSAAFDVAVIGAGVIGRAIARRLSPDDARVAVLEKAADILDGPALIDKARANGATLLRRCEVTGGEFDGSRWRLDTSRGAVGVGIVVNAAGLPGDIVDECLLATGLSSALGTAHHIAALCERFGHVPGPARSRASGSAAGGPRATSPRTPTSTQPPRH